ncbi:hypothetical protein [Brachybacterium aquaticum]|uniref:Uncharacterized protein n=1 Tax=Brachybacterium aquaticum TaxID=1432564 RepID=A0A841ADN9_9MICO|nr:hypothetical protein [Brachybacterium aquaticum]MBB5831208.1 hypothetical protein [Brachybacterium aquaticum]
MTEPETTEPAPRRGRRARALTPEEEAAFEARAAAEPAAEETGAVSGMRGAVAVPGADAPVPTLRKFGRRARIIELSEEGAAPGNATATATAEPEIERDRDGVELGELSVTEAPDPRPAPRFEGRVLHRPESTGGRRLLWLVWVLVALAIVALVILLLTGIVGPGVASSALAGTDPDSQTLSLSHPVLEEPAA